MSFYKQPPILSFSLSKMLFVIIIAQILFTFVIFIGRTWLTPQPLTWLDAILGGVVSLLGLCEILVWKKTQGKTRATLHWTIIGLFHFYISGLFLSSAMSSWSFALRHPLFLNAFVLLSYIGGWILPWFFQAFAQKIYEAQWKISGPALGLSGIAGIIGASIGMFGSRGGRQVEAAIAAGVLMTLLAVGWAQFAGYEIWRNRPWAKENE